MAVDSALRRRQIIIVLVLALAGLAWAGVLASMAPSRTIVLLPFALLGAAAVIVWGPQILVYLLAFIWSVPLETKGIGALPFTTGMTGWELILWVSAVVAVFVRASADAPSPYAPRPNWLVCLGLLLVSVSSLMASHLVVQTRQAHGWGMFRYAAVNLPLCLLVFTQLIRTMSHAAWTVAALILGGAFYIGFPISVSGAEYVNGRLIIHGLSLMRDKYEYQPNAVGLVVTAPAIWALAYSFSGRRPMGRLISLATYYALGLVTLLTASRGQLAAIAAGSMVFLVLFKPKLNVRALGIVLVCLGGLAYFAWREYVRFDESSQENLRTRYSLTGGGISQEDTLGGRLKLWQTAWGMFETEQTAIGYGYFAAKVGRYEHNIFVALLCGGGYACVGGFVLFLAGVIRTGMVGLSTPDNRLRAISAATIATVASLVVNGMTIEIIYPTYAESYWVALAMGLAICRSRPALPAPAMTADGMLFRDVRQNARETLV